MGDQPSLRRDFADAFDDAAIALCASVEAACAQGRSWPGRVTAAVYAVLEFFVSEPEGARVLTVDAVAFGPYGAMRRARLIEHFAALLATGRDYCATGTELPCLTEQALVGGIAWVISGEVSDGRADRLGQLLPGLVELTLLPYLGLEGARRWGRCSGQVAAEVRSRYV